MNVFKKLSLSYQFTVLLLLLIAVASIAGYLIGSSVYVSEIRNQARTVADLRARGIDLIMDNVPQPFDFTVNEAMLEAMMLAVSGTDESRLSDDDLLARLLADRGQIDVAQPGQHAVVVPGHRYPAGYVDTRAP